ncbi:hypothetical protein GOQ27_09305 [Clostridium sp. D2Q-11]|uniref:Lipoprotein n=1 Tax=Anaeromonas frigoriresistens TaxID=2683708 RepID=A0A942UXB6_9FIRM|nr:hypothetical protein [Anaeromonas frigoriresistens]MBS4538661.1 hypothetical protein [Anaeromonas frigoriresistens]
MTKRNMYITISILILVILLSGCTSTNNDENNSSQEEISNLEEEIESKQQKIDELKKQNQKLQTTLDESKTNNEKDNIISKSIEVMKVIKEKNTDQLSSYVHPEEGLRFSPYFNVDKDNDKMFSKEDVAKLWDNSTEYKWGNYDGSGNPIELTFKGYYEEFIYNKDFINPEIIGNNVPIGEGNTLDNIKDIYPDSHFIEFHFTGSDTQAQGMDWQSLRLVFKQKDNTWHLIGIVHGQWTI